jgi:hypothetical protein
MLQTGIKSKTLNAHAITGDSAKDLALNLMTWFGEVNVVVKDIHIAYDNKHWNAIILFTDI